jgi:homoserine O-acetyltransferase
LSTSPSSSQTQPDLSFPRFSIRDMVASQRKLLEALGVERLASVVGASMGGMRALQWAVSQPDRMRSVIALVPMARTRPWSVAMNEIARRILRADPGFPSGPYGACFEAWAALTRVITNREPAALEGIAAAAIPGLVDQVIEPRAAHLIRSTGSIRAGPTMRTMSVRHPGSTAIRRPRRGYAR